MRLRLIKLLTVLSILGFLSSSALGQSERKPKRLSVPSVVRGLVGGEANDTYVVHVRKGRLLTIRISWTKEEDNIASFGVSASPKQEPVQFGKESDGGRKWVGRVPRTGDYLVEVVAHPSAHYVLRITAK